MLEAGQRVASLPNQIDSVLFYLGPTAFTVLPDTQCVNTLTAEKQQKRNILAPVESRTRTHNGQVGSARRTADGGAGRRWAEQGADISVALEANRPSGPPTQCKKMS